jgi:predicted RNase H-like nuclease
MATNPAHLIGIDGYPKGWVGALLRDGQITWRTEPIANFSALLAGVVLAAVDIPVGLKDDGWRACDAQAKVLLGFARSRVFMTPPRAVLELGLTVANDEVQSVSRALTGQGVSRQALGLATRVLDVDGCLPDERIIEVHPELSFLAMSGVVLPSKKSAAGVAVRISALQACSFTRGGLDWLEALSRCPADVPVDDALDALAALWTALRYQRGDSERVLPVDELDPRGTRMQITY